MQHVKLKRFFRLALLVTATGLAAASNPAVLLGGGNRAPDLPALCGNLQVPPGNHIAFRVYALGVQVYRWNGTGWDFVEPVANLYADDNYRGQVGTHYAGPTWESNSGSKVIARRVSDCSPDPSAIPWLLLETVVTDGPGIFSSVSYIHRINTVGGLRPAEPGAFVGAEMRVPYTAEYYFYRPKD